MGSNRRHEDRFERIRREMSLLLQQEQRAHEETKRQLEEAQQEIARLKADLYRINPLEG